VPRTRIAPAERLASFSREISSTDSPRYSVWSRPTLVSTTASGTAAVVASYRAPRPASSTAHESLSSAKILRAPAVSSSNCDAGTSFASATSMTPPIAAANRSSETSSPRSITRSVYESTCGER
jgi:hypothetical protein